MIYVFTRPQTILERLNFLFRGIVPTIACSTVRTSPAVIECVMSEDSCRAIPMGRVMEVVWESGYKQAFDQARKEYFDGLAQSMNPNTGCSCGDEDGDCDCGPYAPSPTTVDGYN